MDKIKERECHCCFVAFEIHYGSKVDEPDFCPFCGSLIEEDIEYEDEAEHDED